MIQTITSRILNNYVCLILVFFFIFTILTIERREPDLRKIFLIILLFSFLISVLRAEVKTERPYVLIISFDGFRWDYPDRGITPNINQMISEGVRALSFQPAFPSKTFPNHYSIVTGLYPQNHGLVNNRFVNPNNGARYKVGDTLSVRDDRWYQGETLWATASREGVKSASFFWPGSETHLDYKHPTYFKYYQHNLAHEKRIQGVIDWLQLPEEERPHLVFLYFSDTDSQGHRFGPDSDELNEAVKLLDKRLGQLRQRLAEIKMLDRLNIILLSDHGMTNVYPEKIIKLYEIPDLEEYKMTGYGPLVQFFTSSQDKQDKLINSLAKHKHNYSVYTKETMASYFHYSQHAFIGDVILVADLGSTFVRTEKEFEKLSKNATGGDHGYDNFALDMHGIFIASGPAFKKGYRTGTIQNIDVYPLVCKILGLTANQMIDGKLERIAPILK